MRVIALRYLKGDYGSVRPGDEFDVHPDTAKSLLRRNLVREPDPFTYEVKAILPAHKEPKIDAPAPAHSNKKR